MSTSFEDYQKEYDSNLSRVRSFLASTRSLSTLVECDRLLSEARRAARAMEGLAEVEGDVSKIRDCRRLVDVDIKPLETEVSRAMDEKKGVGGAREELFRGNTYAAPGSGGGSLFDVEQGGAGGGSLDDTEQLIQDSERLLRESQNLCAESEQIGSATLQQMGSQREQLYISAAHTEGVRNATQQAGRALREMSRRAAKNRIFLYFVIALLIFVNSTILFRMIFK